MNENKVKIVYVYNCYLSNDIMQFNAISPLCSWMLSLPFICLLLSGLVPNEGQFPIPTGRDMDLLSTGPICRYAIDLMPLLKIYAGPKCSVARLDDKVKSLVSKKHV